MLCLLHEELYLPVILLEGITKHLAKKYIDCVTVEVEI